MTITVSSGVTSSGLTISAGDPLVVLSGGEVRSATILSGGSATLSSGAVGYSMTISSGGLVQGAGDLAGGVDDMGSLNGVILTGGVNVLSGTVTDVTVADGGGLVLFDGGLAIDVTVSGSSANFGVTVAAIASGTVLTGGGSMLDQGSSFGTAV